MSAGLSELLQALFPDIVRRSRPETARDLMVAAGSVYFALNGGEKKMIEDGITDLLGPGPRAEDAKRKVFGHILEHYFEKLLVANRSRSFLDGFIRKRVAVRGLESLDAALARGRGAIAVTAHWGAVELIPPALAALGYPVSVVLEASTPRLRAALERLAVGRDVELIIASRGDRVLERIFGALKRGRVLMTQVDEVDTYVFAAEPKRIEKNHRYFAGKIWVDQQDFQIVLINGKTVPQDTRPGHEDLQPPFTTYYEQVDGKYWFPTYTKAEGVLHFAAQNGALTEDIHLRSTVRYTDYKRFRARSRIIFNGQDITNDKQPADQSPEQKNAPSK